VKEREEAVQGTLPGLAYFKRIIAERRAAAHPGDDFIGSLVAASDGNDRLDDYDIMSIVLALITAGSDTATDLHTYAIHGHESAGYSSTLSAWDLKFIKRYGSDKNFVFGHTHQPGILSRAFGFGGKVSPRFTCNVGSIMDPVQATYVKDGAVSWVQSFALLRDDGKRVYPELILATDRGFYLNGKKY